MQQERINGGSKNFNNESKVLLNMADKGYKTQEQGP